MDFPVSVHIGYPKSASTTLQKHLFDRHPQLAFLGSYPTENIGLDSRELNHETPFLTDERLMNLHDLLVTQNEISYAETDVASLWQHVLKTHLDQSKTMILSNEGFTSVYFTHPDIGVKAKRLKNLIPDAKIIVVIRNQISLALSQYRDHPFNPRHLSIGRPMSPDEWMETALEADDCFFLSTLDYYRVLSYYWQLFGQKQVQVFLFEELVQDLSSFGTKISHFMGIDADQTIRLLEKKQENRGVSAEYNRLRKASRRYSRIRELIPLRIRMWLKQVVERLPKQRVVLSKSMRARAEEYFIESNKRLIAATGLPLSQYEYPC